MSEEQRERDVSLIAKMQRHISKRVYESEPQGDMFLISTTLRDIIDYGLAERRERMRLTEELDQVREQLTKGVPETKSVWIIRISNELAHEGYDGVSGVYRTQAQADAACADLASKSDEYTEFYVEEWSLDTLK